MKVTIIGGTGSGKTTYMGSLYQVLGSEGNNNSGFHIAPRAATLDESILRIGDFGQFSISNTFEWPAGTKQTTVWPFDVKFQQKTIAYFDWIDYRGGILSDITNATRSNAAEAEIRELLSHIELSNAVILVADAFTLTHFPKLSEARMRAGVDTINKIFEAYSEAYPERDLIFVIVLTQADAVESKWKTDDYKPLIERGREAFEQMMRLCKRNPGWVGGIVPVSVVGEGAVRRTVTPGPNIKTPVLVKDEIIRFPDPMNVEHVLFYCLGQTLRQMKEVGDRTLQEREQKIVDALSYTGLANRIWSSIMGRPNAREIARALLKEQTEDFLVLRQFEGYIDPLYSLSMRQVKSLC